LGIEPDKTVEKGEILWKVELCGQNFRSGRENSIVAAPKISVVREAETMRGGRGGQNQQEKHYSDETAVHGERHRGRGK